MNCTECIEKLVEYTEDLVSESQRQMVEEHLKDCRRCQTELKKLKELSERLTSDSQTWQQTTLEDAVFNRIIVEQNEKLKQTDRFNRQFRIWRKIMNSKITKFATAAVIIVAVILTVTVFNKTIPTASAAEVFAQAVEAISNLNSIHIKARMRTLPADNFSLIKLEHDFVPIELWKKVDESGLVKWKVEKPGRLLVMDGNSTIFLVRPNVVGKSEPSSYIRGYDCDWFGRIANIKDLLESEYKYVQSAKNTELLIGHEITDGREKLTLEVDILAKGDYKNDYLKNKFIDASDHTKIYHFDAETKLLEGFEIIVHNDQNDVLVFETTEIEYNPQIDDGVFTLNLPDNIIQFKQPEILSNNEKYEKMGPKETAAVFFNACAQEDWDEFLKFWTMSGVDQRIKAYLGGLEIISLGEPFKSGLYPGWFVPYEIKLKDGTVKKHNLAVRNDNLANRYVVDGGI
ncbi:MAG: zf-HC2 domain-containing protein [Planctomycetota bacterium]